MKKGVLFLILLAILFCPRAFAEGDVWEAAESEKYGTKFGGMLGRGVVNVATCFVDIIVQTVDGTKEGPPFVGTLTGLGGGLGCTALRVTSGALDILTSWVPGFNGIPVSRSYSDCLDFEEGKDGAAGTEAAAPSFAQDAQPLAAAPAQEEKKHDPYEYVKK